MKRNWWISAALAGALSTFSFCAQSRQAKVSPRSYERTPTAIACADTTKPPSMSFAKGFVGGWQPVTDGQIEAGMWGRVAEIWPREDDAGTFLEFKLSTGDRAQFFDYRFRQDGSISWIHVLYNSFSKDSRIEPFNFNSDGVLTKHNEEFTKLDSEVTRPADELCQDLNSFRTVKRLQDFSFLSKDNRYGSKIAQQRTYR